MEIKEARTFIQYLSITLRGLAMGAADVIPGVSGGTIAFITGIYEELISSISNINLNALKKLKNEGIVSFWKYINGNFFVALLTGVCISILSLANVVTYLIDNFPILMWAFFFGLVVGSAHIILKSVDKWNVGKVVGLLVGMGIAVYVSTVQTTAAGNDSYWYIFLSGAIAICAMILPGVSGSFLLVLLGSYTIIMKALKDFDLMRITVFVLGCVIGILSFSHLLKWLFKNYKDLILAILLGFLLGSLLKIWPWQNKVSDASSILPPDGKEEWLLKNVLPGNYDGGNPQILYAVIITLIGYLLVYALDRLGSKKPVKS